MELVFYSGYVLFSDPLDFFVLDSATGELRTAKPLDREALADPSSPLNLTVRVSIISSIHDAFIAQKRFLSSKTAQLIPVQNKKC